MDSTDNAVFRGLEGENREKTMREVYSAGQVQRENEERALAERHRKERLYGSIERADGTIADVEDTSGVIYRTKTGELWSRNNTRTGSDGVTEGTYAIGNPDKAEAGTYMQVDYEIAGDGKIEIENVRTAENAEGVYAEGMQKFADDIGREISWKGETFKPAETVNAGTELRPETNTEELTPLTGAERNYIDGLKRVMPKMSEAESRLALEVKKLQAGVLDMSFDDYITTYHQEGVFSDTDANILAAARGVLGLKKGATRFDPETGKAAISGSARADFSTALHEDAHVFRKALPAELLREAEGVFGVENGNWEGKEEDFADALVKYFETGEAPTPRLGGLFQKIKDFLGKVYKVFKNNYDLTPEQKNFFDRMFSGEKTSPYEAEFERKVEQLNEDSRNRAREILKEEAAGRTAETEALNEIIADDGAAMEERADAAAEKAGLAYEEALWQNALDALPPGDRKHEPTAVLIYRAMEMIKDPQERNRIIGEIRELRDRYGGTPQEYKAPNGKPSLLLDKLGEEAGKQTWYSVRTSGFKEWFGDWERTAHNPSEVSKVIDANGEPKPVFHGTHAQFDIFDRSKGDLNDAGWSGEGHYFYEDWSEATQYAKGDGHVMAEFINVREPYYLSDEERTELVDRDDRDYSIEFTDQLRGDGYDGVYYNGDLRKEWTVFDSTQIKSATDNAITYSSDNPSILFQDEAFTAFIKNNPSLVSYAAQFSSKEDFMFSALNGFLARDDEARALIPVEADKAWFDSFWESAVEIAGERRGETSTDGGAGTGGKTAPEHFIDFINTDEGLDELFTYIDAANDPRYSPMDEEDARIHEAEKAVVDNVFKNSFWSDKNIRKAEEFRAAMRGMIRKKPVPYMNAYAVLSGNEVYLTEDDELKTLINLAPEREAEIRNADPEQRRRISRQIAYKGVEEEIEKGTLKRSDPRIPEFEEENKIRQKNVKDRIARKIERIEDYEDWIRRIENAIEVREKLASYESTQKGLEQTAKSLRKLRELRRVEEKARREYSRFLGTLNQAMKQQFLGLRDLYERKKVTEKNLAAVGMVREIRKKQTKRVVRKPDYKTINIDQARLIEGIQYYFNDWYATIPKWIGPKAKNLRQLYNDFANSEDYREKLKRKLGPDKYRTLERVIYADREKKTIKDYGKLTRENRNRLYSLLIENEEIFKDLGLYRIDVVTPKPEEAVLKKLEDLLPADILYKLRNVSLAEWSINDMETLGSIISNLRDEGRAELKAKRDARREIINRYRGLFLDEIGGSKQQRMKGIQSTASKEAKEAKRKGFLYNLMNPRRFFRMLDGGQDRAFHEIIYRGEDQAYNNMMRYTIERRVAVDWALKKKGVDIKDLWRVTFDVQFGNRVEKVTLDEMLYFHRAGLNDRAWQAVVFGNFATSEEKSALNDNGDIAELMVFKQRAEARYDAAMKQLEEFLSKEENKKFGKVEEIIGADYDGNYGRLKEFVAAEFNEDLGSEAYYVPIKRLEMTGAVNEEENIKDVLSSAGFGKVAKVADGFKISRQDIAPAHQKPVKAGLYKSWDEMVEKQERLMAYSPYVRMIRNIFSGYNSDRLRSAIDQKYSKAANDYIDKYIAYVANPQPQKEYNAMDAVTRLLRGNYPTAVLGWRMSSVIKQAVTSPPPFFQYVSIPEYVSASAQIMGDYKNVMGMIREKSVFMKTRVYDPSIQMVNMIEKAALEGGLGKAEAVLNKINKAGMTGLEMIDLACVAPGWLAAYNQKLAQLAKENGGMTEALQDAEAVRYADQVVRDTQPSSRGVDMAPLFRDQKGIAKAFLQFQVPMSVIFQNIVFDMPTALKNGQVHQLFTTLGIYALTAVVVGAMEDDDDDRFNGRDIGASALGGLLESIPVFGNAAARMTESAVRGEKIRSTMWNIFPIMQTGEKAVNAMLNKNWGKAADAAADAIFYSAGLPAGLKSEIEKAVESEDWKIFFGVK
ncbi:MAG: hypothetical protein LBH35_08965 [Treponema sp.]|nr:hypothetical protein [Treponema sp.]